MGARTTANKLVAFAGRSASAELRPEVLLLLLRRLLHQLAAALLLSPLAATQHPTSRIRDHNPDPMSPVSDLDGMRFLRICREPTTPNKNQGNSNGTADPSARDLSRRFSDARPCPEDEFLIFTPWLLML
jgi:acetyl esterase/lipase